MGNKVLTYGPSASAFLYGVGDSYTSGSYPNLQNMNNLFRLNSFSRNVWTFNKLGIEKIPYPIPFGSIGWFSHYFTFGEGSK